MKVFHAAVSSAKFHHCLELFCDGRLSRVSPNVRSRKVRQHRRVFDLLHVRREGVANAEIYLHPDSRGTEIRPIECADTCILLFDSYGCDDESRKVEHDAVFRTLNFAHFAEEFANCGIMGFAGREYIDIPRGTMGIG